MVSSNCALNVLFIWLCLLLVGHRGTEISAFFIESTKTNHPAGGSRQRQQTHSQPFYSYKKLKQKLPLPTLLHQNLNGNSEEQDEDQKEDRDEDSIQREINAMMSQQEQQSMQSTLFGLGEQEQGEGKEPSIKDNAVPLFTGSLVLLTSLFFTGYGFYVFFSGGDDPIFQNVRPTELPTDTWYPQK
jgi:hypothetical protein